MKAPKDSGVRGVFWRAKPNGTQERRRSSGVKERGDWWVRWSCGCGRIHRTQVGPNVNSAGRERVSKAGAPLGSGIDG
jgi:hypothetical protein